MPTGVEYIRDICKDNKIPVSSLEKACGFANGYLNPKKASKIPYERALQIVEFMNTYGISIDLNAILGVAAIDESSSAFLTKKDERDIAKDLDRIMGEIKKGNDEPLYYNGIEIDDASIGLLQNAIEYALRETKKENKVKYNPNKNKK